VRCEPFEVVDVTVPNEYSSAVVDLLNKRKGEWELDRRMNEFLNECELDR